MGWLLYSAAAVQPIWTAYELYKTMTWKFPSSWEAAMQPLSEGAHTFAKQHGLRNDIRIVMGDMGGAGAEVFGCNSLTSSDIAVVVDSSCAITENSSEEQWLATNFVMRHEFSHLRNDDLLVKGAVSTIACIAGSAIGVAYLSPLSTLVLSRLTGAAATALYSRYMEGRADDEAIAGSSIQELEAAKSMLVQTAQNQQHLGEVSVLGKIIFSAAGNDRRQLLSYPSLTSRIKKVENAIASRQLAHTE